MGKKSRTKGGHGEREFARMLTERVHARGYREYSWERNGRNGIGSADVISPNGGRSYEVKRRKSIQWLAQAFSQASEIDGHLALRLDRGTWWVAMPLDEYVKETKLWQG